MSTPVDVPSDTPPAQYRVDFDAEVRFSNGGGLTASEFRLDIPGQQITDAELAAELVAHLGLLMVGEVIISRKRIICEPHKGSRGVSVAADGPREVIDLGSVTAALHGSAGDRLGLVDLPAVLIRLRGGGELLDRVALSAQPVAGRAVVLDADRPVRLTAAAAGWLVEQQVRLVAGLDTDRPAELAGIPVLTGLDRLDQLPARPFRLHVLPGGPAGPPDVYAVVGADS